MGDTDLREEMETLRDDLREAVEAVDSFVYATVQWWPRNGAEPYFFQRAVEAGGPVLVKHRARKAQEQARGAKPAECQTCGGSKSVRCPKFDDDQCCSLDECPPLSGKALAVCETRCPDCSKNEKAEKSD